MKRIFGRKRSVALGVVLSLAVAGAAFAYWTTSGSGSGSATMGQNTAVTVTQTSTIAGLVPDGAAQPIDFKINNPATTPQYISNVEISIASIKKADGTTAAGCSAADFDLVQPDPIGMDLKAGDTAFASSGASLAMNNLPTNQDGCKGVTVNLAYQAS